MVHNEVVKRVNIHDAKTHLSHYLAELTPGETLAVSNRNQPVAELRLLRKKGVRKPRIGAARGAFVAAGCQDYTRIRLIGWWRRASGIELVRPKPATVSEWPIEAL